MYTRKKDKCIERKKRKRKCIYMRKKKIKREKRKRNI